jgi:hypothetical protein
MANLVHLVQTLHGYIQMEMPFHTLAPAAVVFGDGKIHLVISYQAMVDILVLELQMIPELVEVLMQKL